MYCLSVLQCVFSTAVLHQCKTVKNSFKINLNWLELTTWIQLPRAQYHKTLSSLVDWPFNLSDRDAIHPFNPTHNMSALINVLWVSRLRYPSHRICSVCWVSWVFSHSKTADKRFVMRKWWRILRLHSAWVINKTTTRPRWTLSYP